MGVLLVTLLVGEAASRWLLRVPPLTLESIAWEGHPRLGWAHRPGAEETFVKLGCRQPIRINSIGLREREIERRAQEGVQRVLVLGDSAVVGFEVPLESVFTRVAESALRERGFAVEFLNAGCRGYGTDQSLLLLEELGPSLEPDLVLYFWNRNDAEDNRTIHRPYRKFGKGYFVLDEEEALSLRGVPVPEYAYREGWRVNDAGEAEAIALGFGTRLKMFVRDHVACRSSFATAVMAVAAPLARPLGGLRRLGTIDLDGKRGAVEATRVFRVTARMLERMKEHAESLGAEFRIIGPDDEWARALRGEVGLPSLGDYARFRAGVQEGMRLHIPHDPHWNELGHRLYGEALAQALLEADLVGTAPGSER
jgi:hypothetical protein